MLLKPDLSSFLIDPFTAYPTLIIFCDIHSPDTAKGYDLDPRHTAILAEEYLKETNIADTAFLGQS